MNSITASFNTTMIQMTKMSQQKSDWNVSAKETAEEWDQTNKWGESSVHFNCVFN